MSKRSGVTVGVHAEHAGEHVAATVDGGLLFGQLPGAHELVGHASGLR